MGIRDIHILTEKGAVRLAQEAQAAREAALMRDHRKGRHPYGEMRRDCPLCQAGK